MRGAPGAEPRNQAPPAPESRRQDIRTPRKVWSEQQRLDIARDDELRVVALNNDRDAFGLVLKNRLPHHVAARHGENTKMFDPFFGNPGFQRLVVEYLANQRARLTSFAPQPTPRHPTS